MDRINLVDPEQLRELFAYVGDSRGIRRAWRSAVAAWCASRIAAHARSQGEKS